MRDAQGRVDRIVEQADADPEELAIDEVNPSIYCFRRGFLAPALRRLSPENAQGEYYLTDVVEVLRQAGHVVLAVEADDATDAFGVNDRSQLAEAEAELRSRINLRWMREGVGMTDPARTYLDTTVVLAPDVQLLPGTMLAGRTVVGARLGHRARRRSSSTPSSASTRSCVRPSPGRRRSATARPSGPTCRCGPAPASRPARTSARSWRSRTPRSAREPRCPHLAYVGDADIGAGANIGAGNITANYDGREKHRTKVGKNVRTGSNTVLVAPVEIGDGAYTGAGSVVNRDVPPGALAKGVPARIEEGWVAKREDAISRREPGSGGAAEGES